MKRMLRAVMSLVVLLASLGVWGFSALVIWHSMGQSGVEWGYDGYGHYGPHGWTEPGNPVAVLFGILILTAATAIIVYTAKKFRSSLRP